MAEPIATGVEDGESPLARFVQRRFRHYKNNRLQLEKKGMANYAAWRRDLSLDPKGPWKKSEVDAEWMSDVVDDITRRKLLAAFGMLRDAITKGGNLAFMFDRDKALELIGKMQAKVQAAQYAAAVGAVAAPDQAEQPPDAQQLDALQKEFHDAEDMVHDQLKRCNGMMEFMRAVFSQLLYGRGWLKRYTKTVRVNQVGGADGATYAELKMPAFKCVSIWRMYWDMENEDVREGDGMIETARWSAYDIRKKKRDKSFDSAACDRAIAKLASMQTTGGQSAGSTGAGFVYGSEPPGERQLVDRRRIAEVYEAWGRFPRGLVNDQLANINNPDAYNESVEQRSGEFDKDEGDDVECLITMVAGVVVRIALTEKTDRPYYTTICEPDLDATGASEGVADALHQTQHTRTGIRRAIENNLKLTSNFTAAGKRAFIRNWTGKQVPGQFFDIDMDAKSVDEAFKQIVFQDISKPLIEAMEFFGGEGDLSSMIPKSEQGSPDGNAPNTAFELRDRLEKAGMYLAISIFNDDGMLEELVRDMLIDNMTMGNIALSVPVSVKALGFTSFQNKTIRAQALMDYFTLRQKDPEVAARTKLTWALEEWFKDRDIAPEQIIKTDEEYAAYVAEQQQAEQQQLQLQQQSGGKYPSGKTPEEMQEIAARVANLEADANLKNTKAQTEQRDSLVKTAQAAHEIRQTAAQPVAPQ